MARSQSFLATTKPLSWFKDGAGNVSGAYTATIILDTIAPSGGSRTPVAQNAVVALIWSGFTDATSGINKYELVYGEGIAPADCKTGIMLYAGPNATFNHAKLANGTAYFYRVCATDNAGNASDGIAASATPTAPDGISRPSDDIGKAGVEREDGGDDSTNIDTSTGKPKLDLTYDFAIVLKDPSGNAPQYIRLYITQRSAPTATDFYPVDLTCTGFWDAGGVCYPTALAQRTINITSVAADGTVLRQPAVGEIAGPVAELLTGYNMVSVPRDVAGANLDGAGAFGNPLTYKWNSSGLTDSANKGGYTLVDVLNPVRPGEGYFTAKNSGATLPEHGIYNDILAADYTVTLQPGWNLISNPYGGNVKLSAVQVQKGADAPATWAAAAASNWVVNAVYYYKGSDWGAAYNFESAGGSPDATLVPWVGYWVYLNKNDDIYKLLITRP